MRFKVLKFFFRLGVVTWFLLSGNNGPESGPFFAGLVPNVVLSDSSPAPLNFFEFLAFYGPLGMYWFLLDNFWDFSISAVKCNKINFKFRFVLGLLLFIIIVLHLCFFWKKLKMDQ